MIVTLEHLRTVMGLKNKPGFCISGARKWCSAHGLSFAEFARHGIDAQTLLDTGCPLARRLVEHAKSMSESVGAKANEGDAR
jgi:hypothetical protein